MRVATYIHYIFLQLTNTHCMFVVFYCRQSSIFLFFEVISAMGLTAGKQRDELLQRAQQLCQAFAERKGLEEATGGLNSQHWWGRLVGPVATWWLQPKKQVKPVLGLIAGKLRFSTNFRMYIYTYDVCIMYIYTEANIK